MSELKDKYTLIAPRAEYLADYVVLAQAWKKTHKYIRHHNWYADVLELDCSTINLEQQLHEWAVLIESDEYNPDKMKIVPAPKNSSWVFTPGLGNENFESWHPKDKQKLRPLAHLKIRDQTIATAVMLCLADAVETAQGPSEEQDFLAAQRQRIYSYGNRLQCEWFEYHDERKRARFGWGNSHCYRKFYEDYQLFLSRPKKICQHYATKLPTNQNLYVVSIDLTGFFDYIDKNALQEHLKKIYEDYIKTYKLGPAYHSDEQFWDILKRIFGWSWENQDHACFYDGTSLPEGLPQGLVASGFLSNAYLLNFDTKVGNHINNSLKQYDFILRDYCRYVDDIRVVVEVHGSTNVKDVENQVISFIKSLLDGHLDDINAKQRLTLNEEKTNILPYRQLSTQNNVSSLMTLFQSVLSGTPDVDSLHQIAGGLDGLLRISDQLENEREEPFNKLGLSRISTPNIDVRDDTLKRFVATRIVKSLRLRRSMTDLQEELGNEDTVLDKVTAGQMLDHEFETTARKLISSWAYNPSLSLLLRCGLDLFPHPDLLEPVLEAIEVKLFQNVPDESSEVEVKAIEYAIADLFRAGAVEIGYRPDIDYPESADRDAFRQELGAFAKRILTNRPESPWYVKQQALLFLASLGDTVKLQPEGELTHYLLLNEAILYHPIEYRPATKWFPIALVAQQLHHDPRRFAQWFVELLGEADEEEQRQLVLMVAMNRPDLLSDIRKVRRARHSKWLQFIPKEIDSPSSPSPKPSFLNNEKYSLLKIIQSNENPFAQENALLLLAYNILKIEDIETKLKSGLSVDSIIVECKDWERIQHLDYNNNFLKIQLGSQVERDDRLKQPSWILDNSAWLYGFGRILRSCITGEYDFTATTFLSREDVGRYNGLRSTWFSRRFGLVNTSRGLLCEQDPVSPWLIEFLIRLLQWPGIEIHGNLLAKFDKVTTATDLAKIIYSRIQHQLRFFGRLSDTPVYELPTISDDASNNKMFRVAIVQTLLPKLNDFNDKDPTHWTSSFRARHRGHIASVCNLVRKQLKTWCDAQQANNKNAVDLIVFPELSVHPDDVWLLRRLSDATRASIFAGMTFLRRNTKDKPINQAIWILRSEKRTGRELVEVRQGKHHMTKIEEKIGIKGYRPYQILVEFKKNSNEAIRVAGAICYDATDLALVADLRGVSDVFVVAALNKDVQTFDNMVGALHYHMFQPVILANTGEFGGSTAQAPFTKHDRLIAHVHGNNQVAISVFEFDPMVFKTTKTPKKPVEVKTPPAGYTGRG